MFAIQHANLDDLLVDFEESEETVMRIASRGVDKSESEYLTVTDVYFRATFMDHRNGMVYVYEEECGTDDDNSKDGTETSEVLMNVAMERINNMNGKRWCPGWVEIVRD